MKIHKKLLSVAIVISFFSTPTMSKEKRVGIDISERGYTFNMEFETTLSIENSLAILYNIEHLRSYLKESMDSRLLESDSSSYDVEFKYRRLFYSYNAKYKRVKNSHCNRVDIKMLQFEQTPKSLPKVIKSSGSYMVNRSNSGKTKISYVQSVCLNEDVGWIFSKVVNSSLNKFADRITEYFARMETDTVNKDDKLAFKN